MPRNSNPTDSGNGNDATILLNMLSAVDEDSGVTQRTLAGNLGIALGLANAYLKRAVKKGLIKVTQAPANRYAYYLTPKGFTEKSQLTAEYFSQSFKFFREARGQCSDLYEHCIACGWRRIAFAGVGDLAEIAIMSAHEFPIDLVGIADMGNDTGATEFAGVSVFSDPMHLDNPDVIIVTDLRASEDSFKKLISEFHSERVLAFPLLGIKSDMLKAKGRTAT